MSFKLQSNNKFKAKMKFMILFQLELEVIYPNF